MTSDSARRRFREVVAPWLDNSYSLAKWMSGSSADAEDIVQDAAMRALAALEENQRGQSARVVARNHPQHGTDVDGAEPA